MCRSQIYRAIQLAELKCGCPPYIVDIARHWDQWVTELPQMPIIVAAINDLYRADQILAD